MNPRVYVETSVISYLTNRPALDAITAGHQATTYQWQEQQPTHYDLVISQIAVKEAGAGDPAAAALRLATLDGIPLFDANRSEVESLAEALMVNGALPMKAFVDALHIAVSSVAAADVELQTHREWFHDEENSTRVRRERIRLPATVNPAATFRSR